MNSFELLQRDERAAAKRTMKMRDGCVVHFRVWQPLTPSDRALLLFHRGHEHSGRLTDVVSDLNLQNVWVFAWDARGHGSSSGPLKSFNQLVDDVQDFVNFISQTFVIPISNMSVVAHSFSAIAVIDWVQTHKPPISSLILLAPAFNINLFVPFGWELLKAMQFVMPNSSIRSYVSGRMITRCPKEASRYDHDPTITRTISVSVLLGLRKTAFRVLANAGDTNVPTLVLIAGNDLVVNVKEQQQFFQKLPSSLKAMKLCPKMRHDIFHEQGRADPLHAIRSYALEHLPVQKVMG